MEFGAGSHPASAQTSPASPVNGSFTFTAINFPGGTRTRAVGLNDPGDIVGDYADASGVIHAYRLSKGTLTSFDAPGAIQTRGIAINNRGTVGGHFLDSKKARHSYLLDQGNFTIFDFPGATATLLQGINARGDVVGGYNDSSGGLHGFLVSEGNFTTIDFPGAFSGTSVFGITANGNIVGSYDDDSGLTHGFQLQQGTFSTIDFPGARLTLASKVNESGQVVGFYNLAGQHGFLASPNPSTQDGSSLYDDFSEGFIDPSRWLVSPMCGFTGYDCAREVQHGHLRLAVRAYGDPNSDFGTSFARNQVMFRNPNSIDSIQANLNVQSFSISGCPTNTDAAHPQLLISGTFFNTGTGDASGDVTGFLMVERRTDDTFTAAGLLRVGGFMFTNGEFFNGVDLGTLQVGEAAQATLLWDRPNHALVVRIVKSSTTPSIVEQSMPYSVPDNQPPLNAFKSIQVGSFIPNCTSQRSVAAMDATIDNVRVNPVGP